MRFTSLFPIACIAISLILSFLALFAGTNHDMLENYDLLLVNTSRIGQDYLKNHTAKSNQTSSSSSDSGSLLGQLLHTGKDAIDNAVDKVEDKVLQEVSDDLNDLAKSLAKDLGLKDFYTFHIMNHCEGFFSPNGTSNRNVTKCSNSTGISHFNLTEEINQQLGAGHSQISLPDIQWPDEINDAIHALELAFNVTFVLYTISIIFTGIALLLGPVALFRDGRLSALLNIGSSGGAAFIMTIASIVITVGSTKAANGINKYGKIISVYATRGDKFISLTWAAAGLLIVAVICWVAEFIRGRHSFKKGHSKEFE